MQNWESFAHGGFEIHVMPFHKQHISGVPIDAYDPWTFTGFVCRASQDETASPPQLRFESEPESGFASREAAREAAISTGQHIVDTGHADRDLSGRL